MRRLTCRVALAAALLLCLAAPASADAAYKVADVAWTDGGRGAFEGRLYVNGFRIVDGRLLAYGRLVGTTNGRHGTGTVDQAVEPWVLETSVTGDVLHLEVGPLEARGSTGDGPQAERVGLDLTTQAGDPVLAQIADALRRGSPTLHLLRLLDRFIDRALPGPITGFDGKCLDVAGANQANGTPVQLYECNGTAAQQWTGARASVRGPSFGTLQALGKCLDVAGAGTANGTPVHLWECNGTSAQVWAVGTGGTLVNTDTFGRGSGKCLDAVDRRSADETKLQVWDCHGDLNQQWHAVSFTYRGP